MENSVNTARHPSSEHIVDKSLTGDMLYARNGLKTHNSSNHVPYSFLLTDNVAVTRNGELVSTLFLGGICIETVETAQLDYFKKRRDALLRQLSHPDLQLYSHIFRKKVYVRQGSELSGYAGELESRYRANIAKASMYVNEHYITVVHRGNSSKAANLSKAIRDLFSSFSNNAPNDDELYRKKLKQLEEWVSTIKKELSAYSPRRLGTIDKQGSTRSELLGFFFYLINLQERDPVVPEAYIHSFICENKPIFGPELMELKGLSSDDSRYAGVISIKEYQPGTKSTMLDSMLNLPHEFILTQSWVFEHREDSLSNIKLQIRKLDSADDDAVSLTVQLEQALDDVASGRIAFGEQHVSLLCHGKTVEEAIASLTSVGSAFSESGLTRVREYGNMELCYWAQLPGNTKYAVRARSISTKNLASFSSFHNYPSGQKHGNHWGDAIIPLKTRSISPYYFNLHVGDLGNFSIVGRSGSGKTVLQTFLLSIMQEKYNAKCVFFDVHGGANIYIRAIGGSYQTFESGVPTGLNPLHLDDTPASRVFLRDFLKILATQIDPTPLLPTDGVIIQKAVDTLFTYDKPDRQLGNVLPLFGGHRPDDEHSLIGRIRPWCGDGEYAWIFDNPTDEISLDQQVVGFDITSILDDPVVAPPLMALMFHKVELRMAKHKTMLFFDEGWKALDIDYFKKKIQELEKIIRRLNGIVGIGTQDVEDLAKTSISSAIINQSASIIIFPDPKADVERYKLFKLTEKEADIVANLPERLGWFLLKQGRDSVVCHLDLFGMHDDLAVLSGTKDSVRIMNRIINEVGDDPKAWLPLFQKEVNAHR